MAMPAVLPESLSVYQGDTFESPIIQVLIEDDDGQVYPAPLNTGTLAAELRTAPDGEVVATPIILGVDLADGRFRFLIEAEDTATIPAGTYQLDLETTWEDPVLPLKRQTWLIATFTVTADITDLDVV